MRAEAAPASGVGARAVDAVLAARLGPFTRHRAWPLLRPLLHAVIDRRGAAALTEEIHDLDAEAIFAHMVEKLRLHLSVDGLADLPRAGAALAVTNHPTGAADGVILHQALSSVRANLSFFSSTEALSIAPGLSRSIIPVELDGAQRSHSARKRMVAAMRDAVGAGRVLVLLPAGGLSELRGGRLDEPVWTETPVHLARRFDLPLVPIHIAARNSPLHYALHRISPALRDLTVFRELMNKTGAAARVTIGAPLDPHGLPRDPGEATERLRRRVLHELAKPQH